MLAPRTHPHADLVVSVALLARRQRCHRIDDVDFQKVGWHRIRVVQRLLLDVQPLGGVHRAIRLDHHALRVSTFRWGVCCVCV